MKHLQVGKVPNDALVVEVCDRAFPAALEAAAEVDGAHVALVIIDRERERFAIVLLTLDQTRDWITEAFALPDTAQKVFACASEQHAIALDEGDALGVCVVVTADGRRDRSAESILGATVCREPTTAPGGDC